MELHSYAKLRGYKKWTIQQKRKLVEARINYDAMFSRKSSNCLDSWKKIMTTAKLNDFNVCFVRKQWANLLAKYKVYKRTHQRHLGKNGEITEQIAREISEDWEFFYPIHSFMSRKPTNFHSYAQKPRDVADANGNAHNKNNDNNEENENSSSHPIPTVAPNTDHDFYSKSVSREIVPSFKIESDESSTQHFPTAANAALNFNLEQNSCNATNSIKIDPDKIVQTLPGDALRKEKTKKKKKPRKPSEREKYYKHKRRYDRRNERRFDALINVFGQIVKEHYPNVDTSKLDTQSDQISTEDDNESLISDDVSMDEDSASSCTSSAEARASDDDEQE